MLAQLTNLKQLPTNIKGMITLNIKYGLRVEKSRNVLFP